MTKKQLMPYLAINCLSWTDFKEWMIGQTVSSNDKGETIYWWDDVQRFISTKCEYLKMQIEQ